MANYTHITRTQLKLDIASMLGDEESVFWTDADLETYLDEALLTFGALAGFWKEEIFVDTQQLKTVYNIFTDSKAPTKEKIQPSITFETLFGWIKRDLIEPNFSQSEFLTLAKAIYNSLQSQINATLTIEDFVINAEQRKVDLENAVIDIVRVKYTEKESTEVPKTYGILLKSDEEELEKFDSDVLIDDGFPQYYTNAFDLPNEINIYPKPFVMGDLEIIYVTSLEEIELATIINLPNNLIPYLKFGILAEIYLKSDVLADAGKAAYCKSRWEEGIIVAKNYSIIIKAKCNDVGIAIDTLFDLDKNTDYRVSNCPTIIGLAGLNVFGIDIFPEIGEDSLEFTCITNAPINLPEVQISMEYLNTLKAYIVHLAQFRCGIAETQISISARDIMLKIAIGHNSRLKNKSKMLESLMHFTQREEKEQPRLAETNG